jgi:hypothetical protein
MVEHISAFLQIMADFGSSWIILYNGPKCGASAPDHLHFQAIPSGRMPIEIEILEPKQPAFLAQVDGVPIYRLRGLGREVIALEGNDPVAVGAAFKRFLEALKEAVHSDGEPMVNVMGIYKKKRWRLAVFPRSKHRPDVFFREGDARIVVSPGIIDMAGILVTPVKKDFERLEASSVESIYREVSLDGTTVEKAGRTIGQKCF